MERSSQYTSFSSRKQSANAGSERKQFTENAPVALQETILTHAHTKFPPVLQLEAMWQINFAPSKCYIVSTTLKRQPSSFSYTLCNTPLEGDAFQKYLGVYITNSLNWTKQAVEVKKRANKILGVLQRNIWSCSAVVKERAYLSLVRPVCEYGSRCLESIYKKRHYLC